MKQTEDLQGSFGRCKLHNKYRLFTTYICVVYASELSGYISHLERICTYRKGKQSGGYENEIY